MASSIIHIAVANEINKELNRDRSRILIGTIAPDISKHIGDGKKNSHFLDDETKDIPNLQKFLSKYAKYLDDDFVLGYYIHLYTDYLWFKYFMPDIYDESKDLITKIDGTVVKCHGRMALQYIYNDYTNMNIRIIEDYNLDLKIFYNEIPSIIPIIKEIPMDKLSIIVNKTGEIILNSKTHKDFTFNIDNVKNFISLAVEIIKSEINNLTINKEI